MHSSANVQDPPISGAFYCLCDKVYHTQEERYLLYFQGQVVTWHYTVILIYWIKIDHVLL